MFNILFKSYIIILIKLFEYIKKVLNLFLKTFTLYLSSALYLFNFSLIEVRRLPLNLSILNLPLILLVFLITLKYFYILLIIYFK